MAIFYTYAAADFETAFAVLQLLTDKNAYFDKDATGFTVQSGALSTIEVDGVFGGNPLTGTINQIIIHNAVTGTRTIGGLSLDLDELIAALNDSTATAVAKIFENADQISGSDFEDFLKGGDGDDALYGWAGDDLIDGGAGADVMVGYGDDDTYFVDDVADQVTEYAGQGIDLVRSLVTYSLGANVENLRLVGADNINGTGNELANAIVGNAGKNVIDGGLGADEMSGGDGDDTYIVDDVGDVVTEFAGQGIDQVYSSVSYTLSAGVEDLTLSNGAANGTGNELANGITGNDLGNILSGLAGNDRIDGGLGDDRINGGFGNDLLTGGAGADSFVFDVKAKAASADSIADFSVLDDTIVLDNAIFKALKKDGVLKEKFFHVGKKASDGNDHVIYNEKKGKLLYDKDGEGGKDAKLVATLDAGLDLTHQDFLII